MIHRRCQCQWNHDSADEADEDDKHKLLPPRFFFFIRFWKIIPPRFVACSTTLATGRLRLQNKFTKKYCFVFYNLTFHVKYSNLDLILSQFHLIQRYHLQFHFFHRLDSSGESYLGFEIKAARSKIFKARRAEFWFWLGLSSGLKIILFPEYSFFLTL